MFILATLEKKKIVVLLDLAPRIPIQLSSDCTSIFPEYRPFFEAAVIHRFEARVAMAPAVVEKAAQAGSASKEFKKESAAARLLGSGA